MAKSEPPQYTSRLIVNTGGAIQRHALKVLQASPKPCRVLDASELNGWDVDWLRYVDDPENLEFRTRAPYTPHPLPTCPTVSNESHPCDISTLLRYLNPLPVFDIRIKRHTYAWCPHTVL